MTAQPAFIEVDDIKVHFGGVRAVDGVSFTIAAGSLCGLVGPNGSGKTTLVNSLSALVHTTAGDVRMGGESLSALSAPERARQGVRRTFQAIRLLPRLTALENVMLGADDGKHVLQSLFRPLTAARAQRRSREAALAALERVGLASAANEYPGALPYGHQRRVEIARALASEPRLLLLDEPVAGMSSAERGEIADLLLGLRAEGLTQLLIEHDLGLVTAITDHLVVMDFGKVIADGDPKTVTQEPQVREAYLGRGRHDAA
ncbi:ABC transporter ATP-binding protein [Agromyces aerolatus]|uniref:ABC transporter ATP-binding protein n=1 Tax=Agromyces sp. LY-1074 TaxID=3074080 RepID=UPI002854483A|nr:MULTISPECIES: ABC transporter ATP-binding protein [unclassified Agromyces]MDR5699764.1 ABC transporter ATP-binding protein [Agromyces sp. LY-1074]MDR5706060.1 ABC transporter ATP-binding protein [Agromyces sp. LY-1358]